MIGVLADDLTGAAEIGAIGLRHGLPAELRFWTDAEGNLPELLCLDTDSRSCSPIEAATRAAQAANSLAVAAPRFIYKKVDSVLRGNVIAEIEAIMKALGLRLALVSPANPSVGRTIRDGRYFIKGQPISETDFARDPEYPRVSSEIDAMLAPTRTSKIHILKLADPLPDSGIIVAEVSSASEVEQWAARVSSGMLCAGGGEFFGALLLAAGQHPAASMPGPSTTRLRSGDRELFVCGSISDYSLRFVQASQTQGVPVFRLPRGAESNQENAFQQLALKIIAAFSAHPRVILTIGLPLVQDRLKGRQLALDLVKIAALVLQGEKVDCVYVEGGATAAALIRVMNWKRLGVVAELAQGVASLRPADSNISLTIKPGSYSGWPAAPSRLPGD